MMRTRLSHIIFLFGREGFDRVAPVTESATFWRLRNKKNATKVSNQTTPKIHPTSATRRTGRNDSHRDGNTCSSVASERLGTLTFA
jgi:hypothetical protein